MDITPGRIRFISVAALTLCACAAVSSFPAVLSLSLKQLSAASQLISEGEVIGTASHFNANETSIHTYVMELYTRVTLPCLLWVFGFLDVDERSNGFGSAFRSRWEVGPFL